MHAQLCSMTDFLSNFLVNAFFFPLELELILGQLRLRISLSDPATQFLLQHGLTMSDGLPMVRIYCNVALCSIPSELAKNVENPRSLGRPLGEKNSACRWCRRPARIYSDRRKGDYHTNVMKRNQNKLFIFITRTFQTFITTLGTEMYK